MDGEDDGTGGCPFFSFYIPRKRPMAYLTGSKLLSLTKNTTSSSLPKFDDWKKKHKQLKRDVEGASSGSPFRSLSIVQHIGIS